MKLGIDALQEAGAFAGAPVEKEIRWSQDGKELTATAYVRKLSYRSVVSDLRGADAADRIAGRIAACICDEDGKPVFTTGDITGDADIERGPLDHNLTVALLNAIAEVNTPGK